MDFVSLSLRNRVFMLHPAMLRPRMYLCLGMSLRGQKPGQTSSSSRQETKTIVFTVTRLSSGGTSLRRETGTFEIWSISEDVLKLSQATYVVRCSARLWFLHLEGLL